MDKKGRVNATNVWIALIAIAFVTFGGVITWAVVFKSPVQQTAFVPSTTSDEEKQASSQSKNYGEIGTLNLKGYDDESANRNTRVSTPYYVYGLKGTDAGKMVVDAAALSTSADASSNPSIGSELLVVAFNTSGATGVGFYGDAKVIEMSGEIKSDFVMVHRACTQLRGEVKGSNTGTWSNSTATTTVNATSIGASGSNFISLRVRPVGGNCAYDLAGFFVDLPTGTNVSDIRFPNSVVPVAGSRYTPESVSNDGKSATKLTADSSATLAKSNIKLGQVNSRNSLDDYVFEFSSPLRLHNNDYIEFGSVTIEADGDGCPATGTTETVVFRGFDKAWYKTQSNTLDYSYEDDAQTRADVGSGDYEVARVNCVSNAN